MIGCGRRHGGAAQPDPCSTPLIELERSFRVRNEAVEGDAAAERDQRNASGDRVALDNGVGDLAVGRDGGRLIGAADAAASDVGDDVVGDVSGGDASAAGDVALRTEQADSRLPVGVDDVAGDALGSVRIPGCAARDRSVGQVGERACGEVGNADGRLREEVVGDRRRADVLLEQDGVSSVFVIALLVGSTSTLDCWM